MLQLSDRQTGSFVIKLGPIVQHLYTYQRLVNQTALKAVKQPCRVFGHISAEERLDSETCESRMSTEPVVVEARCFVKDSRTSMVAFR